MCEFMQNKASFMRKGFNRFAFNIDRIIAKYSQKRNETIFIDMNTMTVILLIKLYFLFTKGIESKWFYGKVWSFILVIEKPSNFFASHAVEFGVAELRFHLNSTRLFLRESFFNGKLFKANLFRNRGDRRSRCFVQYFWIHSKNIFFVNFFHNFV